jgi:hypothetical protein
MKIYMDAMYYIASTVAAVGNGTNKSVATREYWFSIFLEIMGIYIHVHLLGNFLQLTRIITIEEQDKTEVLFSRIKNK